MLNIRTKKENRKTTNTSRNSRRARGRVRSIPGCRTFIPCKSATNTSTFSGTDRIMVE